MISVICVYNNKKLLDQHLLNSLKNQNKDYELILIDNTYGKFKSAAEALNYGGAKAKGQYLMFIHQDFELEPETWLEETEQILDVLKNLGVAGVAGKYDKHLRSNITTDIPPILPGIHVERSLKVQTLDECLFIIPKRVFKKIKFDEVTCDNWHLYATDYCLTAKKSGYNIYVLPMGGYHVSPGYSFSKEDYLPTLRSIIKKYKSEHKWIYTTTGSWSTIYPLTFHLLHQKLYYRLLPIRQRFT